MVRGFGRSCGIVCNGQGFRTGAGAGVGQRQGQGQGAGTGAGTGAGGGDRAWGGDSAFLVSCCSA